MKRTILIQSRSIQLLLLSTLVLFQMCSTSGDQVSVSFPSVDKEPLVTIPDHAIVLHEDWQMKESAIIGMDGEKISMPHYQPEDWYPTTVPTTILGVLVRNGVYPDPYIGLNNMKIPDVSDAFNERYDLARYSHMPDGANPWAKPYWFRKAFQVPADYDGKKVWLNLDGMNYRADVWVNGHLVADSNEIVGMFQRFRLDITDYAMPGEENALAICIHQLDFPGDPLYAQLESLNGWLGLNSGDGEVLHNVTQYSTLGWDWVPAVRDRNTGIWQHVSINATGAVVIADPVAFTDVIFAEDTTARVTVRFFVTNAADQDQEVKLNILIKNDNQSELITGISREVRLEAGSRQEIVITPDDFPQLTMIDPDLWWPVTYGDQPLYKLEVTAEVNGRVSNTANSKFGVREVDSYILPSGGRAFSVNETPIRITGGAWISDFLLSWSAQRYRDEVRLMAEGNATVVRVNGCSIMPPDVFYDACDEYGLLIWQDFSRTSCTGENMVIADTRTLHHAGGLKMEADPFIIIRDDWHPRVCDSTIYMDNMVDFISRVRGRSSLLLWCGCNEAAPQENTGKALQNHILPTMDGTRIFLPSSHEQPEWSAIDLHTWTGGPWHMVRLPEYYARYDTMPGYESRNEIGLPSVLPINHVAASMPDFNIPGDEFFPLNTTTSYHDATNRGTGGYYGYTKIMHQDIGMPSSMAEFVKWGDLYNNQTYRTIFEAANKARPRNELTVLWKSNAAWPSFMWQIFDWYLKPNAGYYTMKSACKPIHVQFSHDDAGIQVVSTLSEKLTKATVKVAVLSADGKNRAEKQMEVNIPANHTVRLTPIIDMFSDTSLYFVAMDLIDQWGTPLDRTVTWTQKSSKWDDLLSIPTADLGCKLIEEKEIDNETEYAFEIRNDSEFPVVNVILELTNGSFGKEILPAFWEDNALTMMPGEIKNVKVRVRKKLITKPPFILAEGLNVNPATWDIHTGKKESLSFKIEDLNISTEKEKVYLNFSASQQEEKGDRITTFPIKLSVDGEQYRYVSVAVKHGMDINGKVELNGLAPGEYQVQMGNYSQMVNY